MIWQYVGSIRSGKSYHAVSEMREKLEKGGFVIANFPLSFSNQDQKKGLHERFMYIPNSQLLGTKGIPLLMFLARLHKFNEFTGTCLCVFDESGLFFPPDKKTDPLQKNWYQFLSQSGHVGYDFIFIMHDKKSINRLIGSCIEYEISHRKVNNFKFMKFMPTSFAYVTTWLPAKERSGAKIVKFKKSIGKMYQTHMLFDLDKKSFQMTEQEFDKNVSLPQFGNCETNFELAGPSGGFQFKLFRQLKIFSSKFLIKKNIKMFLKKIVFTK